MRLQKLSELTAHKKRRFNLSASPLLSICDLSIGFTGLSGETRSILRNVNLAVNAGESIGIVGESGSGKSTVALAAMGYLKRGLRVIGGNVNFLGNDMFKLPENQLRQIRGSQLALIPQNSGQSLTPSMRIGSQLTEALELHSTSPKDKQPAQVIDLLSKVRLPDPKSIVKRYPHELSGGQQQRVAVAMALAGEPQALLLDEPTTGLDVTTQAHILELLRELALQEQTAMVYVSHDLGAIARVCERIVVMYAGEIVLEGSARLVLKNPVHPYASGLLASIPRLHSSNLPASLEGIPPIPGQTGDGCAFAPRCALAETKCYEEHPRLITTGDGQISRCHFADIASEWPIAKGSTTTTAHKTSFTDTILALDDVSISYAKRTIIEQLLGRESSTIPTVYGINISLNKGETIGLVGESGSGKSTILKTIAGLLPTNFGSITLNREETMAPKVEQRTANQLRVVQLVFQNPDESLNPRQTVSEILAQPLKHYFNLKKEELHQRSCEILNTVRLGEHYLERLPSQLSGGEKQRVAIARAFVAQPDIVLCDEITSALDVSVQAAVLRLLDSLRKKQNTTCIFVSHDLAVVKALADRVAVLYQGRLCEIGTTEQVFSKISHPYTKALLSAVLEPDPDHEPQLTANDIIELSPPPQGCPFQRRCANRIGDICDDTAPPWQFPHEGHAIRCHLPLNELQSNIA